MTDKVTPLALPLHVVSAEPPMEMHFVMPAGEHRQGICNCVSREVADAIVLAVNSHDALVKALEVAEDALSRCYDVTEWPGPGQESAQASALVAVRSALDIARGKL